MNRIRWSMLEFEFFSWEKILKISFFGKINGFYVHFSLKSLFGLILNIFLGLLPRKINWRRNINELCINTIKSGCDLKD